MANYFISFAQYSDTKEIIKFQNRYLKIFIQFPYIWTTAFDLQVNSFDFHSVIYHRRQNS